MTNNEMDLKMESLLKQQENQSGQITEIIAALRKLEQQQERSQTQIDKHSEQIGPMMEAIVGLTAMTTMLSRRFEEAEIARREADQALKELAQQQTETSQALKTLAENQDEQRERLDAFILVLERYISERNGDSHE